MIQISILSYMLLLSASVVPNSEFFCNTNPSEVVGQPIRRVAGHSIPRQRHPQPLQLVRDPVGMQPAGQVECSAARDGRGLVLSVGQV